MAGEGHDDDTPFYLASAGHANSSKGDGRLTLDAAGARGRRHVHATIPANPVPARGGSICCTGNPKDQPGSFDQADIEQRADVLVYSTDALREGLELTGPMQAVIAISSDASDTDVTVKLLDVFPDGRVMNMQEGITRVRYRDGFDEARLMKPGTVYDVPVDLHATSWYLARRPSSARRCVEFELSPLRSQPEHRRTQLRRNDLANRDQQRPPFAGARIARDSPGREIGNG